MGAGHCQVLRIQCDHRVAFHATHESCLYGRSRFTGLLPAQEIAGFHRPPRRRQGRRVCILAQHVRRSAFRAFQLGRSPRNHVKKHVVNEKEVNDEVKRDSVQPGHTLIKFMPLSAPAAGITAIATANAASELSQNPDERANHHNRHKRNGDNQVDEGVSGAKHGVIIGIQSATCSRGARKRNVRPPMNLNGPNFIVARQTQSSTIAQVRCSNERRIWPSH